MALSTSLSALPVPPPQAEDAIARCMLRMATLSHRLLSHLVDGRPPKPLRLADLHRWEKSLHQYNHGLLADLEAVITPPPNLDPLVEFFGQEMEAMAMQPGVDQERLATLVNRLARLRDY